MGEKTRLLLRFAADFLGVCLSAAALWLLCQMFPTSGL
jgi:hypothetical protein